MKQLLFCLILVSTAHLAQAQVECTPPLGATLAPITWNFSTSNWFVDYMKQSKPSFGPVSGPWDPGSPTTDSDGWPTEPFSIWVKLGVYPQDTGVYHLEFEGFANLFVFGSHILSEQQYDPLSNQTTAKLRIVAPETQIALQFGAPMSPVVRHIRMIAPGFDPANHPTFHPDWIDHLSRFPVLRFMTWNAANFSTETEWTSRNTTISPSQAFQYVSGATNTTSKGVAWEYVTEVAHLTGSDIWINIPIGATDGYITELGKYLLENLPLSTKIYVEYANEVWNTNTAPYHVNRAAAIAEVNSGNSNLNYDGSTNTDIWAVRRYARRTKEIGALLQGVFGANALFNRIFPVLGHQVVTPKFALNEAMTFMEANYGPPQNYYWGVAGAPFLNGDDMPQSGLTVNKYFDHMQSKMERMFGPTDNFLDAGVSFAQYYNLRYMAHEAGSDTYFFGSQYPQALRDTIALAQQDPRMKNLMVDYLRQWFRYGGRDGLFTWFVAGGTDWRFGDVYGLVNDRLHLNGPKMEAIDEILAEDCPTQFVGHLVPGTIDARQFVQYPSNWDATPYNGVMFQGNSHQYLLQVADSCHYSFSMVVENPVFGPSMFEILLDGSAIDTLVVNGPQTAGFDTVHVGQILLSKGVHTLRLRYLNWCYGTHALLFDSGNDCSSVIVETLDENHSLRLFPNPSTGSFYLQIPHLNTSDPSVVCIKDVLGRTILEQPVSLLGEQKIMLDSRIPTGFYTVSLGIFWGNLMIIRP